EERGRQSRGPRGHRRLTGEDPRLGAAREAPRPGHGGREEDLLAGGAGPAGRVAGLSGSTGGPPRLTRRVRPVPCCTWSGEPTPRYGTAGAAAGHGGGSMDNLAVLALLAFLPVLVIGVLHDVARWPETYAKARGIRRD